MVQNLAKSPLVVSIGGVGAIALTLIGLAYLGQPPAAPDPELTLHNFSASPWQQGTDLGWQAAVAAQSAQTQTDWGQVTDLWDQAIVALESVAAADPNYAQAQAKAQDYRRNRAVAADRQAKAQPAAPSPETGNLQRALAAADPGFTFAPAGATGGPSVGKSTDGLATVELAANQATLVLPRPSQGDSLTMAQAVYAHQFLSIAAPATPQPWLIESLRAVQSADNSAQPSAGPVTLSAGPESVSITVATPP
ncbi:MAG TPA: hypothetical protein VLS96_06635 [Nodosilinea sp.]|nr:hypothetical protein [Nodosilinea sp.]